MRESRVGEALADVSCVMWLNEAITNDDDGYKEEVMDEVHYNISASFGD